MSHHWFCSVTLVEIDGFLAEHCHYCGLISNFLIMHEGSAITIDQFSIPTWFYSSQCIGNKSPLVRDLLFFLLSHLAEDMFFLTVHFCCNYVHEPSPYPFFNKKMLVDNVLLLDIIWNGKSFISWFKLHFTKLWLYPSAIHTQEFLLTPDLEYFSPTFCLWLQYFAKSQ